MGAIIDKIDKLLALAGNNPSEEEAMAAMTKARELMAKYNIDEARLNQGAQRKIGERASDIYVLAAWKRETARLIADYFRCRLFFYCSRGKQRIAFFGYETDCEGALGVYEFSIKHIGNQASRYARSHKHGYLSTRGDYIFGFLKGLRAAFEMQTALWKADASTTSLVLASTVPQEVLELYKRFSERFVHSKLNHKINIAGSLEAAEAGYKDGKDFGQGFGRVIEAEGD